MEGIFLGIRAYDIKNAGKGGCDEASSGICLVLCGDWNDFGTDSSESICGGAVYYIMYIGRI